MRHATFGGSRSPTPSTANSAFGEMVADVSQLVYPCGSGGNAEKALGIRIRETFETQGSVLGNFVLKVHGLLNTKTGEAPRHPGRSSPAATPRLNTATLHASTGTMVLVRLLTSGAQ